MKSAPVLSVTLSRIVDLEPYARNARKHSADQIGQIVASIRTFGWTNPILVDEQSIVAGHGRFAAAQAIYDAGEAIKLPNGSELPAGTVPTIDCSGWTEDKRRAYIIADNKIAEGATWDDELLKAELVFLDEATEIGIDLTGFSEAELSKLLSDGDDEDANNPDEHWRGMPEFDQQDKKAFRTIPVHFKDQAAVDAFAKLVGQKITPKTRFLWYPQIEIETYADKRYVAAKD